MRSFRKHTEGWQAGLLVLVLAGTAILFVMPRAAEPQSLPQPTVSMKALRSVRHEDELRAQRAERQRLDLDVRRLGSALRAYNKVVVAAEPDSLVAARARVVTLASAAVIRSRTETLALRAYQMRRFIEALRVWEGGAEQGTEPSEELRELGGDFVSVVTRSGWCEPGSRRLLAGEFVLRALFKKRWSDVSGIKGEGFDLTEDEDRVRYAFLIAHPFVPSGGPGTPLGDAYRRRLLTSQMKLIERLSQRDSRYPADIARGVLFYRAGKFPESVRAFQRWLGGHPDGAYTLRARNYLKSSLDAVRRAGF